MRPLRVGDDLLALQIFVPDLRVHTGLLGPLGQVHDVSDTDTPWARDVPVDADPSPILIADGAKDAKVRGKILLCEGGHHAAPTGLHDMEGEVPDREGAGDPIGLRIRLVGLHQEVRPEAPGVESPGGMHPG